MPIFQYEPQSKQKLLHSTDANEIFYGGAAGGGKSFCSRWDAIEFCTRVPGLFACLFRRTMPRLESNHIVWAKREITRDVAKYNETKKRFEFRNGSILNFKHLEYERDCDDIQGWELHWAGLDEAGQFTPYQIAYVKSRMRLGGFEHQLEQMVPQAPYLKQYLRRLPRLVLTSNPGGEAHHYLKENYIDPYPVGGKKIPFGKGKKTKIFIPAGMSDNSYLDEDYDEQFNDLPEWQRRQLVDGDWNVIPGAAFDCWGPDNVIKPFRIPEHWHRFWSCDWGFRQPFWIGEWAVAGDEPVYDMYGKRLERVKPGALILVWEWYGQQKGNTGIRLPAGEVAAQLLQERGDLPGPHWADPSMWRSDSGPSPAERAADAGVIWAPADNERVPGWQEMYARIKDKMLLAFETCPNFIRVIPTLQHSDKPGKEEDIHKSGEDHPGDGGRYACMSRPYRRDKAAVNAPYWLNQRPPTLDEVRKRNQGKRPKTPFRERI